MHTEECGRSPALCTARTDRRRNKSDVDSILRMFGGEQCILPSSGVHLQSTTRARYDSCVNFNESKKKANKNEKRRNNLIFIFLFFLDVVPTAPLVQQTPAASTGRRQPNRAQRKAPDAPVKSSRARRTTDATPKSSKDGEHRYYLPG